MTRTVRDATVLITGGADALGRLFAERAVLEGARHVVLWDADEEDLAATVEGLQSIATGRTEVHRFTVDLSDAGSIAQAAQRVRRDIRNPDIVLNNAGVLTGGWFWDHDSGSDIRSTVQVDALAPMYVVREFLPGMMARSLRASRIVNIASSTGLVPSPGLSVYAAAKSAVIGWGEALRIELQQQGHGHVRVTTVIPGAVSEDVADGLAGRLGAAPMSPEYLVERIWPAMLAGEPLLMLPWTVGVLRVMRGVMPARAWDALMAGALTMATSLEDGPRKRFGRRRSPERPSRA